jgi:class 3 adenylate cyclase
VRIGIHTGLVVAGEMAGSEELDPFAIFGEAPNVAARLQSLADANQVVMSAATYRLIRGQFFCESLGSHVLKGIPRPVGLDRALRETGARGASGGSRAV